MDDLFKFIQETWLLFVCLIFAVIVWKYNLLIDILSLMATFFLGYVAWKLWLHYVQQDFISGIDWVMLEIVPPRDVDRSPQAMELFFTNALYHWSFKGGVEEYWQGAVWFWFSLEIVSIEGQVHFYVRTPSRIKPLIETQMYAQYPQCQVKVVDDYTLAVDKISKTSAWQLWGCEFKLLRPDAYPIKTYADFGLDDDPKEEYKVDPISPIIEFFSSMKKGEQAWMQIVITPSKKKYKTKGSYFWQKSEERYHDWVQEAQLEIQKMLAPYTRMHERPDGSYAREIRSPDFLKKVNEEMAKKIEKLGFDTGIRVCYVAKKEVFNQNNRRAMRLLMRQYAMPSHNQFWRVNSTQPDNFGGITSEIFMSDAALTRARDRMLTEYRERSFFHTPLRHHIPFPWPISPFIFPKYFHVNTFVLNVEELATIFHFPGQILKVPTLERIESKEASPPTNLPT
jgi:hypothetical protein